MNSLSKSQTKQQRTRTDLRKSSRSVSTQRPLWMRMMPSGIAMLPLYVILLVCLSVLPPVMSNTLDNLSTPDDPIAIVVGEQSADESSQAKWRFDPKSCNIYENEPLHAIMDRVCELCHDMYSHQNPNMRVECRSDCFRSENFEKCLRLFKPSRALRSRNQNRTRRQ